MLGPGRYLLGVIEILLLGGFAAILIAPGMTAEVQGILLLYVQFFFIPPALFTFFIAGFVAPRASYLFGLAYGVIAGGQSDRSGTCPSRVWITVRPARRAASSARQRRSV